MKKLRFCSDLHLEFDDFHLPILPTDVSTILVLAGDIGLVHKSNLTTTYIPFLARVSDQFQSVILIMGNHEHYGGSFRKTESVLRNAIANARLDNVHLLEKSTVIVDNIAFIGATMWTNCDNHSPFAHFLFDGMSDSRVIRTGPNASLPYERKFTAEASWVDHMHATKFIFSEVQKQKSAGLKTVVVTHHGPTMRSIHQMYVGDNRNMFYASELTNEIMNTNPDLWIHGHTHTSFDYLVDNSLQHCQTRVLVNPRGYAVRGLAENVVFNEFATVEL